LFKPQSFIVKRVFFEYNHSRQKRVLFVLRIRVSLSPMLNKKEKVEQRRRKKTNKPNAFRFWVEVMSFPCVSRLLSHYCLIFPDVSPLDFLSKWYQSRWLGQRLTHTSIAWSLYRKSSWRRFQASVSHLSMWTTVQVRIIFEWDTQCLKMFVLEEECINVEEGLSLDREIVMNPSKSKSQLNKNEKVKQHINI